VRGRLVVGADGRSSIARKALNAREREHRSSRLLAGVRLGGLDCADDVGFFLIRDDATGMASLFPQGDGYARGYVFVEGVDPQVYAGEEGFRRFIDSQIESGVPPEVFARATQEGPLAAFEASDSWVDRAARDGLVLIGDAAGVSDPTWGFGLALAFRDVRTLRDALVATPDWDAALETYSTAHADYFAKILEGENWQSDLFLTPGPAADARRMHAVRAWSDDPSRSIDLAGEGPSTDLSAAARIRFFAEDLAVV
jgi:2-polyprenyl-6-methoxyphenol hydroxylase-like FAD-dependent oxidoreductase